MSWSLSIPPTPAAEFAAAVDAAVTSPAGPLAPSVGEQVAAAKAAAKALVAGGSLGDGSKTFAASLSGHANEGHQPTEGWANDCLTISLSQSIESVETAAAAQVETPTRSGEAG